VLCAGLADWHWGPDLDARALYVYWPKIDALLRSTPGTKA
jgi:hypothetical protein